MKTLLISTILLSSCILTGCLGSKTPENTDPFDTPPVTSGDVADFNTLIGGSWFPEGNTSTMFTFKGDNTFSVTSNGNEARGPWIVSEGSILLGEEQLELIIIDSETITIQGKTYLRAQNDV